jgi:hypothetical protein
MGLDSGGGRRRLAGDADDLAIIDARRDLHAEAPALADAALPTALIAAGR